MSNVLIGIIGVILFIGLTLAGALILGDDFKTASSASQGAALMNQLKQAADAGEMYRLKTGRSTLPSRDTAFLVPRFLKTPAINPTPRGRANPTNTRWGVAFNNNMYADGQPEQNYAAKWVQATIGPQTDEVARTICLSINETYGRLDIANFISGEQDMPAGCALTSSNAANYNSIPQYVAFIRVAPMSQNYLTPSGW